MINILEKHDAAFKAGKTRTADFRIAQLNNMINLLKENEKIIIDALRSDYLKPVAEIYVEINYCIGRANYLISNMHYFMKPRKIRSDMTSFNINLSSVPEPYGNVLVIAPWNFPIILSLEPLMGAISAGNTVALKLSEAVPTLAKLMKELSLTYFDNDCITFIDAPNCGEELTKLKFDYIFYTGSTAVGKLVMESAAKNLIPLTLELGGKCPAYIHNDCDLLNAAYKIASVKTINAGQICISINYVLCHKTIVDQLITNIIKVLKEFFTEDIKGNKDYGRIVTKAHTKRIADLITSCKDDKKFGGEFDIDDKYVQPTIFLCKDFSSNLLETEIFGPIIPIVPVENEDEAIKYINSQEKPLEIYVYTNSDFIFQKFNHQTSSGGITRNESFLQMSALDLPFGGVGSSGMGKYHGKENFVCFSHYKSMYVPAFNAKFIDSLVYPPYTSYNAGMTALASRREIFNKCSIL